MRAVNTYSIQGMGCSKLNSQDRQSAEIQCWLSFLTVPGAGYKTHNSPLAAQFAFSSNQPDWKNPGPGVDTGKGSGSGRVNSLGLSRRLSVPAGPNRSAQKQLVLLRVRR